MCSSTKLYNNLYKRWGRIKFCDEEVWLWTNLQSYKLEANTNNNSNSNNSNDMMDDDDPSDDDIPSPNHPTITTTSDELVSMFKDAKMARVLNALPFVLKFNQRVAIFHSLIAVDKTKTQDEMYALRMLQNSNNNSNMHPR